MTDFLFFFNAISLGVALAMDAFSVSIANGLSEPKMSGKKTTLIASSYAVFQFAMPFIGWLIITLLVSVFSFLNAFIPWVALIVLCYLGIKMLVCCIKENKNKKTESCSSVLTFPTLLLQSVATSIDALSVGLTVQNYLWYETVVFALIIGLITFCICLFGLFVGKKLGKKFSYAEAVGGIILIAIGLEIFFTNDFTLLFNLIF